MAHNKYNGMKLARDWVGKSVEVVRGVGNSYCQLPAGYKGRIVSQCSRGLSFEGDACECCKVKPCISRLGYHDVRLAT